jgi:phosphoribosylformylglycinamidine synthase
VEVKNKQGFKDHHAEHIKHDIESLGLRHRVDVRYMIAYQLEGELNLREINTIVKELLIDPITEESIIHIIQEIVDPNKKVKKLSNFEVEVWFKHGVTDTVSESVIKAVKDLGIEKEIKVRTGHKYIISGNTDEDMVKQIAEKVLANTMVQRYIVKH